MIGRPRVSELRGVGMAAVSRRERLQPRLQVSIMLATNRWNRIPLAPRVIRTVTARAGARVDGSLGRSCDIGVLGAVVTRGGGKVAREVGKCLRSINICGLQRFDHGAAVRRWADPPPEAKRAQLHEYVLRPLTGQRGYFPWTVARGGRTMTTRTVLLVQDPANAPDQAPAPNLCRPSDSLYLGPPPPQVPAAS